MSKFRSVGSYSAVAALVLSLWLGTSQAHAGELPTLVELQAAPVIAREPIVVAAINKIAKSAEDPPLSKGEKKANKKLAKIENEIRKIEEKLKDPTLSTKQKAKLERKLAEQKTKQLVAEQKVQLAAAEAEKKQAKKELKQAKKDFRKGKISQEELDKKIKAVADARDKVEQQKKDVQDAKNGKPVDDSNDDPKASASK